MAKKTQEIEQNGESFFATGDLATVETLWQIGKWQGLPHWTCLFCPFDTLDGEAAMLDHWREVHAAPAPEA